MKLRLPQSSSRPGILGFGLVGTIGFGLLGLLMLSRRSWCEPILRLVLQFIADQFGSRTGYQPSVYIYYAWMPVFWAIAWFVLFLRAWLREPALNRRIDARLRSELEQSARGAPIEPD
ncbi:hypothetical protein [Tsuneonella mangrovi]|uniref:hypothetical protein n=1 Tax=Tsuneonella mangrovi TaxID=1982042 RepID=UPI001237207E|nr:hypothetical protein [Tsuneonella mangrovi]